MVLPDVNVLVYAHREDAANHVACREWLEGVVNGDQTYAVSDLVLSGFVRVVTHPKVFKRPSNIADAFTFA
ncbi:MAG TPA: VapC toxin family PIN domain ribonuclease, partial [Burkholderiales bacterium]|nr:VapC toxin family PIN domain ribonuclease [Burkholderiales bacterium]